MAPKRKRQTPAVESPHTGASSDEKQRKEDKEVENAEEEGNESSGDTESAKQEPGKPLRRKTRSQLLKKRPTKRARKGSDANEGGGAAAQNTGEGSRLFQRIWSEKDEIKLLRGMIKFRNKKMLEPLTNFRSFKDFLDENSVRFDFPPSESQFYNKIKKMKAKFISGGNVGCTWKKPHDRKVHKLSRVLWGSGGKKSSTPDSSDEIAAAPSKSPGELEDGDWASTSSLLQLTSMGLDEEVLKIGMGKIDSLEMEELKERWRQLRMSELQVAKDRATLMNHQAKLFMDGYRRAKQQSIGGDCDP